MTLSTTSPGDEREALIDAWSMEEHGFPDQVWFSRKEVLAILARFGTRPAAEPCKGTNCKAIDGIGHSKECRAEHEAVIAAAANAERPLFDPNFPNQGYVSDAEWSARIARRKVAEPSQSGSAGEAGGLLGAGPMPEWAHHFWRLADVWHEAPHGEPALRAADSLQRFVAALSRQAPAAPAAVDFEKWWLAEVAANGGVPIGADYKHWAKAGFELRGEAEAMALLGWTRYEKARKLNVAQWAELHQRNLRDENFDDMIDALPATTQPVQQDTKGSGHD